MIHDPEPRPRPRPQQHRRHRRPHDQRSYQHSLVVDEGDSPPDGEGRGLEHKLAEGDQKLAANKQQRIMLRKGPLGVARHARHRDARSSRG